MLAACIATCNAKTYKGVGSLQLSPPLSSSQLCFGARGARNGYPALHPINAVQARFCSPIPLRRTIKYGPGGGWGQWNGRGARQLRGGTQIPYPLSCHTRSSFFFLRGNKQGGNSGRDTDPIPDELPIYNMTKIFVWIF